MLQLPQAATLPRHGPKFGDQKPMRPHLCAAYPLPFFSLLAFIYVAPYSPLRVGSDLLSNLLRIAQDVGNGDFRAQPGKFLCQIRQCRHP